ncbi:cytochrome oxidase putative small subunit CydP [Kaarinaea lacus]
MNSTSKANGKGKSPLRKEIIITLTIKFIFIFVLWYVFFSDPIDDTLSKGDIEKVVYGIHAEHINSNRQSNSIQTINPIPEEK